MINGKYIVIKTEYNEMPVLFPFIVKHNSLVASNRIVSAGFWKLEDGKFICYGESNSLQLKSRPEIDNELMNTYFNLNIKI